MKTETGSIANNLNNNKILKLIIYSIDYFLGLEEDIIYNKKLNFKDSII